jgi:hypothetical protein
VRSVLGGLLGGLLIVSAATTAARSERRPGDLYASFMVAKAKRLRLSHRKAWLRLGHWRRALWGHRSEVDGRRFFLSPRGKKDPAAELEATIRGFFAARAASQPTRRPAARRGEGKQPPISTHALCRYPARFLWLDEQLGFDPARLPKVRCRRLMQLWRRVQPRSATLVFSSYYLNNPASAFGHTFLRLGKAAPFAVGKRRELLDYAVSFSADVDTGNAILYAFKGLMGLFPGTFKLLPYYYKVREYNDYESRDIWEYELALRPKAIRMLLSHLWELSATYFDYFYASENCSYHILGLLEAAAPELDLLGKLRWPVTPADTVHAVSAVPGLVRKIKYRPSARAQFRYRIARLSAAQRSLVGILAAKPRAPLPAELTPQQQVAVLDAAADLIDVRYARELIEKKGKGAALKQALLARRAKLRIPSERLVIATPRARRPDLAHPTSRLGFGAGWSSKGGVFQSFDFRLALHDLADPPRGQPELAQIEFSALRFHYRHGAGTPLLRDYALVRILSLSPLDRYSLGPSWKLDTGLTTIDDEGCDECLAPKISFGAGASVSFWGRTVTAFLLLDTRLLYGPGLDGIEGSGLRAGVGGDGGLRVSNNKNLTLLLTGRATWLPAQTPQVDWTTSAILRWGVSRHQALSLEGGLRASGGDVQLLLLTYY